MEIWSWDRAGLTSRTKRATARVLARWARSRSTGSVRVDALLGNTRTRLACSARRSVPIAPRRDIVAQMALGQLKLARSALLTIRRRWARQKCAIAPAPLSTTAPRDSGWMVLVTATTVNLEALPRRQSVQPVALTVRLGDSRAQRRRVCAMNVQLIPCPGL